MHLCTRLVQLTSILTVALIVVWFTLPNLYPKIERSTAYSKAVTAGDLVFLSGQGSIDPETGRSPDTFEEHVEQAIKNVEAAARVGGVDLSSLASCHVYLDNIDNFDRMNRVYGSWLSEHAPARTTVAMAAIPGGFPLEITCVAARDAALKQTVYRAGRAGERGRLLSPGQQVGDFVFVSGIGSRNSETRQFPETFVGQVRQTMENIRPILDGGGLEFNDIVWLNVYVDDDSNLAGLERVLDSYLTGPVKPGRAVSVVKDLPAGTRGVEITPVAARPSLPRKEIEQSSGVKVGDLAFVSAHSAPGETIEDQMNGAIEELRKSLESAGMDLSHVVKMHVYLTNVADFQGMNRVFRRQFGAKLPARTTVQVLRPAASPETLVEITCVASIE